MLSPNEFSGFQFERTWRGVGRERIFFFQYPARSATTHVTLSSLETGDGYFFPCHLSIFALECILNEYIYLEHSERSQGESKQEMKPLHLFQFNILGNNNT